MEDFLPTQPGAEEIRRVLDTLGVFLEDSDREYDAQARDSLGRCIRMKTERYREATGRLQENHTMQGIEADLDSPVFKQKLESMGLARLKREIDQLTARRVVYTDACGGEESSVSRPKYNPERTIFVMDPPREFKSKTAMNIFLGENPDVATQHSEYTERQAALEYDSEE
jgi:hypothetical protein